MTRRGFSLVAFPSAASRGRLPVIVCALLTFWAGFDSQLLLQAGVGREPPSNLLKLRSESGGRR